MTSLTLDVAGTAQRSLAHKTAWSALSVLALTAGRFIAGIVSARTLGPSLSGQLVYLLWLADSASLVAGLGLHSALTRFTAELHSQGRHEESEALFSWALARYGAMQCFAAASISFALPRIAGTPISPPARLCLLVYLLGQAANTFVFAYLAGRQRFDVAVRLSALSGIALSAAVCVGCWSGRLTGAVIGYTAGTLPAWFVGWRALSRTPTPRTRPGAELRRRVLRYGLYTCFGAVVSAFVWSRTEIYFLTRYCGFHSVALFNVGLSLCAMTNQAAALFTGGLVPHFAGLAGRGSLPAMQRTYESMTRLAALVVFPLSLTFAATAPVIVPLLYGPAFRDAVPTASVLAFLASTSIAGAGSALVYGRERSWFVAASGTGGAILAILGGMVVVPAHGPLGAAASRAVVQGCMIGIGAWYIQARLHCPYPWLALAKTMAAAISAAALGRAIVEVRADLPGLAAACVAIAIVYVALVRRLGLFRAVDATIVYRMLPSLPAGLRRFLALATDWLSGAPYQHADHLLVQ